MTTFEYPTITLNDGDKRFRSLEIKGNGDLVFEQTDMGQATKNTAPNGGDSDYEVWVTVESQNVSKVLIGLISERFEEQGDFIKWLKAKSIEYGLYTY